MQFSIRTLLWMVLGLAFALAAIRGCYNARMSAGIVSHDHWPRELDLLVSELNIDTADMDVRIGPDIVSYYWKMPTSPQIMQAHVTRFQLVSVSPNGPESKQVLDYLPRAWKRPSHTKYQCFANPVGMP